MATVFGTDAQVLSTWPAGIRYNPNEDKYTFSVANNWKISPQDHLHVVDIDGPSGLGPYELTLQLPILNQLPFSSRMYFFYVSNSQDLDVLTFIPTPLSGDTVNGSPFFHSFTMDGVKKLFIALAVNGNYIIHEFGGGGGSTPSGGGNPLNLFRAISSPTPVTPTLLDLPPFFFDTRAYTSTGWGPTPDPSDYITGMDGFIVPNTSVDFYDVPGFDVVTSGIYRVTYCGNGILLSVPHTANNNARSPLGIVFTQTPGSEGDLLEYIEGPASSDFSPFVFGGKSRFIADVGVDAHNQDGGPSEPANSGTLYFGDGAFGAEHVLVNGMNGYITPNIAIPAAGFQGFRCNVTGDYEIVILSHMIQPFNVVSTDRSVGTYDFKLDQYNSDGSGLVTKAFLPAFSPMTPPVTTYDLLGDACGTLVVSMTAGKLYAFHFNFDYGTDVLASPHSITGDITFEYLSIGFDLSGSQIVNSTEVCRTMALNAGDQVVCATGCLLLPGGVTYSAANDNSSVSFEYLGPIPPPVAPLAFRSAAAAAPDSNLVSPMHSQLPPSKVAQLQKQNIIDKATAASSLASQQARQLQNASSSFSSSSLPPPPGFTLADIEKIVGQALAKQSSDSAAVASAAADSAPTPKRKRVSIGGVSSSSSSSSSSKSRKLTRAEEKEQEIL